MIIIPMQFSGFKPVGIPMNVLSKNVLVDKLRKNEMIFDRNLEQLQLAACPCLVSP